MTIEEIKSKIDNLQSKLDECKKRTNSEIAKLNYQLKQCDYNDLIGCCFTLYGNRGYYCVTNIQICDSFVSADTICVCDKVIRCDYIVSLNFYLDGITFISKDEFLAQYNKIQTNIRKGLINII